MDFWDVREGRVTTLDKYILLRTKQVYPEIIIVFDLRGYTGRLLWMEVMLLHIE